MNDALTVKTFPLGEFMTNCYLVAASSGRCWIVDPGFGPGPMLEAIERDRLTPTRIVLTHAHADHIAGLGQAQQAYPHLPILLHEAEQTFPADPGLNLSAALNTELVAPEPTQTLQAGQVLELEGHRFEVCHAPGHSPGGIALYCAEQGVALVGDALFAGAVGRTDFPTSEHATLIEAIKTQLMTLPDDTRVLPGHGPETTIGHERATNPFLQ